METLRQFNIGDRYSNSILEWKSDDGSIQIWSNTQGNRFTVRDADSSLSQNVSYNTFHSFERAKEFVRNMKSEEANIVVQKTPSGMVIAVDTVTGEATRPYSGRLLES